MDSLDLDINNYTLDDLLNLFKLDYSFTLVHLKKSKLTYLKTHPDKSNLDIKYFLFFKKAYETLEKIFYFRMKRKGNTDYSEDYKAEIDKEQIKLLHGLNGKSIKEFNNWFNDLFEKVKVKDEADDSGYAEWYKKEETIDNKKVSLQDFGREFEKRKIKCKSLIVSNKINDFSSGGGGYSLDRDKPQEYSSDIFSKLRYEDLKKAHTETVIPVTREDFDRIPKFDNIDGFIKHRKDQDINPISLQQSNKYLDRLAEEKDEINMKRAFGLVKRDIEVEKSNKEWWRNLKLLNN